MVVVVIVAFVVGLIGAWSLCGFLMVETLVPVGYVGWLWMMVIVCVTFAFGALVGGVIMFGGLLLFGDVFGVSVMMVVVLIVVVVVAGEVWGAWIVF